MMFAPSSSKLLGGSGADPRPSRHRGESPSKTKWSYFTHAHDHSAPAQLHDSRADSTEKSPAVAAILVERTHVPGVLHPPNASPRSLRVCALHRPAADGRCCAASLKLLQDRLPACLLPDLARVLLGNRSRSRQTGKTLYLQNAEKLFTPLCLRTPSLFNTAPLSP